MATVSDRQRELRNAACIVGVDESDQIGTLPNTSQLSLHLEAISNAVRDAGLKVKDVDGIFTAGQHSPATLGEALGVTPRYVDGTTVGGCSFIIMVEHAAAALHHGLCDVAVVSHAPDGWWVYAPASGSEAFRVERGLTMMPNGAQLDETEGNETLYLLSSEEPFEPSRIRDAIKNGFTPPGLTMEPMPIVKQRR